MIPEMTTYQTHPHQLLQDQRELPVPIENTEWRERRVMRSRRNGWGEPPSIAFLWTNLTKWGCLLLRSSLTANLPETGPLALLQGFLPHMGLLQEALAFAQCWAEARLKVLRYGQIQRHSCEECSQTFHPYSAVLDRALISLETYLFSPCVMEIRRIDYNKTWDTDPCLLRWLTRFFLFWREPNWCFRCN